MSDHYVEFVAVTRYILQCDAEGEEDMLEAMEQVARGDHCDGLQVLDTDKPVLIHKPYGSFEFGPQDDGPAWFAGNVFGEGREWMKDAAAGLVALADEPDD